MDTTDERGILSVGGQSVYWLMQGGHVEGTSHVSPYYLSAAEWAYCSALKSDKRRRDWLLGRHAAKKVVAELLRDHLRQETPLDHIVILPHADGWPMVSLPDDLRANLTLSISHSHSFAFCAAAARPQWSLGADIEYVEPRSEAFITDYFTSREGEFLAVAPPEQRVTLSNAIWSGKEAALKAIRRGLAEDTRIVSCLPHPLTGGSNAWLPMPIIWNEGAPAATRLALSGYWRMRGDFVMTLVAASGSG